MNKLQRIDEFKAVLKNYTLSDSSLSTLADVKLVLLVAPTAGGRNTLLKTLLQSEDYYYIVSDTTRNPRVNNGKLEQNGHEYWFRTEEEMLADLKAGKFLEAALIHNQQVSGISIRELQTALNQHKIAITDAEIMGADSAVKLKPDTTCIFVVPPSFELWQDRLVARGRMEVDEYKRRMHSASQEFKTALDRSYYKFVINDTVDHAVAQIDRIARLGVVDDKLQQQARQLVKQLLDETEASVDVL